ncbi:hypothetical protein [Allopontixanthobacter sp.]|uniref:hypothetical protein n=1 Tax=Allopontixanthobacter sp. TaxID=2906452 RepID=UPI002ABAE0A1|nr:hypothetical protein [Allopontixanthobacter sp.]MDZ4308383.1 hypothetical protein [Allopontixanthobacter sp.]
MKPVFHLLILCVLTACGPADNDPGPGGVTVGEARALDEAAEMLEARRAPAETIVTEPPEDGPATAPGQE